MVANEEQTITQQIVVIVCIDMFLLQFRCCSLNVKPVKGTT